MHSLIPTGYEPSNVMLHTTTPSEEYLEFSDMAQCCCSRFQRSILQRFLLQGRIGYWFPIRLSKHWMCSSEKCWPNTAVDDLMKLIALSRLSLRCFGFWFGGVSGSKDVVDSNTKLSGKFWSFLFLRIALAPLVCHGLSCTLNKGGRSKHGLPNDKNKLGAHWDGALRQRAAHCREDELIWRKTRRWCCLQT